jgi:hypothetical protein
MSLHDVRSLEYRPKKLLAPYVVTNMFVIKISQRTAPNKLPISLQVVNGINPK